MHGASQADAALVRRARSWLDTHSADADDSMSLPAYAAITHQLTHQSYSPCMRLPDRHLSFLREGRL